MSLDGWKGYELGELVKVKGGKRLPKGKSLQEIQNAHPYIRVSDMGNRIIDKSKLLYVPDKIFTSISRYIVNAGDIILSIVGTIGLISQVTAELDNASLTENCVKFTNLNGILREYLYYFLISGNCQNEIRSKTVGTTQPKLPLYNINSLQIKVPPLPTQCRIAEILSSLDDKIELNRQTNTTLEAIAQAIFKEWFVDFNFPGATGEMVESELGLIPKGWRIGKLGEVCELIKGVSYSSDELQPSNNALVTLKSINRRGGFNSSGFKEYTGKYKASQCLDEGDLIFAQTDITQNADVVGSPAIVENPFRYEKLIASLDIVKCIPTNEMPSSQTLFYFLQRQEFKYYCLSQTNGSTVLHLRSSEVPNYLMIIPCSNILREFDSFATSYTQNILVNNRQNLILGELRDTMLPKLMNGVITS
jgi:type I restriction enzyme S subunit